MDDSVIFASKITTASLLFAGFLFTGHVHLNYGLSTADTKVRIIPNSQHLENT
ncbi:hypothetical protein BD408DRAFT_423949 [Parasitella parasitica]|nr:hypothetical protein BD408DRAFT_423949 [Parasitella parasitica]